MAGVSSWCACYKTTELSAEEVITGDLYAGCVGERWYPHAEQMRCRRGSDGNLPSFLWLQRLHSVM